MTAVDIQTARPAERASVEPAPRVWHPPKNSARVTVLIVMGAIAGILSILAAWNLPPFASTLEQTENAYVRGRTTVIAPQVSGYVVDVPVQDFEQVAPGQILIHIEDRIYRQRVEQASAALDAQSSTLANSIQSRRSRAASLDGQEAAYVNAQAQLLRAQADMARVDDLALDGSVSLRERDQIRATLRQAEAQVQQAEAAVEIARQDIRTVDVSRSGLEAAVIGARAALRLAEIDLSNTVIRAPEAGQLGEIGARRGQYVTNGTQLMSLVPPDMWIIANYKEAQTASMALEQPATFRVDALGNAKLAGHVERLSPAAGSEFAILKPDNATGNFVKVAQRIAVRIRIDSGQPLAMRLRPGMSVETEVDTQSRRSP